MRRIITILLVNLYVLCSVTCLAAGQEAKPEPIRKVDKTFFQGNTPISSKEVSSILKTSGNPDIEKMLRTGKKQKIVGGVLLVGGTVLMLVGISMSRKTVAVPTMYGDVYASRDTGEGTPQVVAGVAAGLFGGILAYVGATQDDKAIDIYNEQVAGVSVTLLDYRW